jgi:ABC-type sugar transport system substrate-binding protein
MRKYVLLFLAACAVAGLALGAFYLHSEQAADEIAVFLPSAENPFWIDVRRGVEDQSAKDGRSYSVTTYASGNLDAVSQVSQMKSVLARDSAKAVVVGLANNRAGASYSGVQQVSHPSGTY